MDSKIIEENAGTVAIVGRPNVGKSALFNRLVGRNIAIVHDQPGITRDRLASPSKRGRRPFTVLDTGGDGGGGGKGIKKGGGLFPPPPKGGRGRKPPRF